MEESNIEKSPFSDVAYGEILKKIDNDDKIKTAIIYIVGESDPVMYAKGDKYTVAVSSIKIAKMLKDSLNDDLKI